MPQAGNYVALKISWPGVRNDSIKYGWTIGEPTLDADGMVVLRLQNGSDQNYVAKFQANGITYDVDLSGVTREADPEEGLWIAAPRGTEGSTCNVDGIDVVGTTVSNGTLAYQQKDGDKQGFYVALYIGQNTKSRAGELSEILWREAGTKGEWTTANGTNGIFELPVKVGAEMFREGDMYTSLEIAPKAAGGARAEEATADESKKITIDLVDLTLGREAEAILIDKYADVGENGTAVRSEERRVGKECRL